MPKLWSHGLPVGLLLVVTFIANAAADEDVPPVHASPDTWLGVEAASTSLVNPPLTLRGAAVPSNLVGVGFGPGQTLSLLGIGVDVGFAQRASRGSRLSYVGSVALRYSEAINRLSGDATSEERPLGLRSEAFHLFEVDFARVGLRYDVGPLLLQTMVGMGYAHLWGTVDVTAGAAPASRLDYAGGELEGHVDALVCFPWARSSGAAARPYVRTFCASISAVAMAPFNTDGDETMGEGYRIGLRLEL
jgi:hypothetical protein